MMPIVSLDRAVVIVGKMESGKSTAVRAIAEELGLKVVSFGALVRAKAADQGLDDSRATLQDLGQRMFTSLGAGHLLQAAMEYAGVQNGDSVVFDGVRHHFVLDEIRAIGNATVTCYLDIDDRQRYERYLTKSQSDSSLTFKEFQRIDRHSIEVGVEQLASTADVVIDAKLPLCRILHQIQLGLKALGMTNVKERGSM